MLCGGVAGADPVKGRVVDGAGRPIADAKVTVEGSPESVRTGVDGTFALDAVPGASLLVERTGFGLGLATAAAQLDDIVLLPEETIEIHGKAPVEAPGAVRMDRESIKRIAGGGNDVVRSMSAMPGVANHPFPLGRNGVVIRGSSPQDSKFLVDDFEVPTLFHDLGFRSVVPVESIDSLELSPGGFDVSHGRATSGIASLTTRAGGEGHGEQAELSAGELGALAQGTAGDAKYTIAMRRSMIDLLLPHLIPDEVDLSLATVPRYYDGQLRIDRELSRKWSLRLSSLGSDDVLEVYASKQLEPEKRLFTRKRFVRATAAARYHDGPWTATLALSGIAQQFTIERGMDQHLDTTAPAVTARAEAVRSAESWSGLREIAWKTGGEIVATRYTLDVAWPAEAREGQPVDPNAGIEQRFDGDIVTTDAAAWTQLGASLDERVRVTAGIRVDAFARNHDVAVQPRGEIAIKLRPKLIARLSAGAYARPPEHDGELLDRELGAEHATQLIAGAAWEPAEGIRVQGSLYYTDRSHLITRDPEMMTLGNRGTGTTKGAELLATYERGRWFGWLAYSYSHSTRRDTPDADSRLFDFDQPHDLNVAGSYRFGKGGKWTLSARFRLVSGMPTTPVKASFYDSDADVYYPSYGEINSERAPMHHQLDLRIDKSWRWGRVKLTKFFDVQNAYLNDTVVGYYYNFDYTQRGAFRMLPIIPTAGLRGEL